MVVLALVNSVGRDYITMFIFWFHGLFFLVLGLLVYASYYTFVTYAICDMIPLLSVLDGGDPYSSVLDGGGP